MHGGGNRIYGRHVIIHNGQFVECKVLENFVVQGQGLVNWSSMTRTLLEDYNAADTARQHIPRYAYASRGKN